MMKYRIHLLTALLMLLTWGQLLHAQCENDTEAPVLSTITGLQATLPETTGEIEIFASDFVAVITDNCTEDPALTLSVEGIPAGESYTFTSAGTYDVVIYAEDEQGNISQSPSMITIDGNGPTDCDPDLTAPHISCITDLEIVLSSETGAVTLHVDQVVDQVTDNCSEDLNTYMVLPGAPMVQSYEFTAAGAYQVILTTEDLAGNQNSCLVTVDVVEADPGDPCQNDTQIPLLHCLNGVVAQLEANGEVEIWPQDFIDVLIDNCTSEPQLEVSIMLQGDTEGNASLTLTEPGDYIIVLVAEDQAGNTASCTTMLIVEENPCINDVEEPNIICINGLAATLMENGEVTVWAEDMIVSVLDNCTPENEIEVTIGLDGGNQFDESIVFTESGTYPVKVYATDESGNSAYCATYILVLDNAFNRVVGNVFNDLNDDCTMSPGEQPMSGWPVRLTYSYLEGSDTLVQFISGQTDVDGSYALGIPAQLMEDIIQFELSQDVSTSGGTCPGSFTFGPEVFADTTEIAFDLPAHLLEGCYALEVDIASPFLRRCFEPPYYVNVCNVGTEEAEDGSVFVTLDDDLQYVSSTIPFTSANGQEYQFDLGDIGPGECIQFKINVLVSCESLLGQTHCTEALVTPASPCNVQEVPQLLIEGECEGDEVVFRITNNSAVDMQEFARYTVVEDVIMYLQDSIKLNGNQWEEVVIQANGSTYYLELEDPEPGSLDLEGLAIEACGTNEDGGVSLGFVTQFPFNSPNPEVDIDCQENIGSFDPNDKQAWPLGTGEDHRIRPGTKLEYMIRFQNTGTDTAFNIVIKDTLSQYLDLTTVHTGASSHPYRFNVVEGNVLQFSFDNIALPDSNINEPASHGFVKFSVEQVPDNPLGTEILNSAAIYFDFNEPIITNTVSRLLSEEVVVVSVDEPNGIYSLPTTVFPNPFTTQTTIQVKGLQSRNGQLHLYHSNGKHLKTQTLENGQTQLLAGNLSAGLYFFTITADGQMVSRGKVVVR